MHIVNIMILAATAMGVVFPIFLINAIRADDEDCASRSKTAPGLGRCAPCGFG